MSIVEIKSLPVQLNDLLKVFPANAGSEEQTAVNHIDLEIKAGELVTLLGPSGCGKTTTLRMLAGFEQPTDGAIVIGNENVTNLPANKRDTGMVFQSYALFPHLTVYENIAYGLKIKGLKRNEVNKKVKSVIELMQLDELIDRQPSHLSGGQQQRVAVARAVVTEPKVLLFDEPLSNLDAKLRVYMREELRKIQQNLNITSLYVTHDQTEAMAISDKVVIMNNGNIEQVGTPTEIYKKPISQFVANFMGKANFLKATVKSIDNGIITLDFEGYTMHVDNKDDHNFKRDNIVHCMARPEFWYVNENGRYQGKVLKAIYFGSFVEYEIQIGQQRITFEDYNHISNGVYKQDDQITLDIRKDTIGILPYDKNYDENNNER
ncbi:iron(III) transport system ATP-binding protein [Virgibacillus halotolerans]|uniref:ABC transporter ATP-binding protein n=1 Tax=Virgibacillus halotolerans TaxID=1071053 RepID=UPI0019604676|nr:ABC transporter ATP-binding protein [Virgibacillus halotolerans]MBM7600079.1 iron(III) transport system ATP-binding protein [Virgibacillus halotolerans]